LSRRCTTDLASAEPAVLLGGQGVDAQNKSVDLLVTDLEYGNDQRFVERRLHAGDTAHVYGGVKQADVGEWGDSLVDAVVADTGATDRFVVSDGTERWTALRLSKWWLLLAAPGRSSVQKAFVAPPDR